MFKKNWVIYAKRPFQCPETIVEYLGRYTHKIAISNHRIKSIDQKTVTFRYKDYRKGYRNMEMTLSDTEFIRRFSQHILPKGFVRIRHYGYLSSAWKRERLPQLQEQFGINKCNELPQSITEPPIHRQCRSCRKGQLKTVCVFTERGPPHRWLKRLEGQQILNP